MDRSAKRERTKNTVSTMPRSRGMVPVFELSTVFKSLATAQSIKKGSKQNRTPIPTQKDVHKFTANHRVQGSREGIDPQIGDQKDTKLFQFRLIEQHTMDCTESGESGRDSISGHSFPGIHFHHDVYPISTQCALCSDSEYGKSSSSQSGFVAAHKERDSGSICSGRRSPMVQQRDCKSAKTSTGTRRHALKRCHDARVFNSFRFVNKQCIISSDSSFGGRF